MEHNQMTSRSAFAGNSSPLALNRQAEVVCAALEEKIKSHSAIH